MSPLSNEALAERIDALREDVQDLRKTVLVQNGRVGRIELDRAREEGARTAVAEAAAHTAVALRRANAIKDKSRAWKVAVGTAIIGGLGGIVTVGTLFAHFIVNH